MKNHELMKIMTNHEDDEKRTRKKTLRNVKMMKQMKVMKLMKRDDQS